MYKKGRSIDRHGRKRVEKWSIDRQGRGLRSRSIVGVDDLATIANDSGMSPTAEKMGSYRSAEFVATVVYVHTLQSIPVLWKNDRGGSVNPTLNFKQIC